MGVCESLNPRSYLRLPVYDMTSVDQYWCAIFCGIAFVLVFFCMEETKFNRTVYLEGQSASITPDKANLAEVDRNNDQKDLNNAEADLEASPTNTTQNTTRINTNMTKKPFIAKLKPMESTGFHQQNRVLRLMLEPFQLLRYPIIVYAGLLYGCNIVWLTFLNATESMVLSDRPYNMSTSMVGLTFIAPLVGTSLA